MRANPADSSNRLNAWMAMLLRLQMRAIKLLHPSITLYKKKSSFRYRLAPFILSACSYEMPFQLTHRNSQNIFVPSPSNPDCGSYCKCCTCLSVRPSRIDLESEWLLRWQSLLRSHERENSYQYTQNATPLESNLSTSELIEVLSSAVEKRKSVLNF